LNVVFGLTAPVAVGTAKLLEVAINPEYSAANCASVSLRPESAGEVGEILMTLFVNT
jgi:hypothetical protein